MIVSSARFSFEEGSQYCSVTLHVRQPASVAGVFCRAVLLEVSKAKSDSTQMHMMACGTGL